MRLYVFFHFLPDATNGGGVACDLGEWREEC